MTRWMIRIMIDRRRFLFSTTILCSESVMVRQFENIFKSYADVPTIARYALGNDARALSKSQMKRFTKVYSVYVSHKYGRRFREFIGGKIVVQK